MRKISFVLIFSILAVFFINFLVTGHVFAFNLSKTINILDKNSAATIPEPAIMMLLGIGLIGLAGLGRKKLFKK